MLRSALTAAGVMLTAAVAAADDPARHLGTYQPKDDDTQQVGGYHRYRGFYPGGYSSFYRPGFYGGFHGGYRPGFAFSYYSAPSFYYAPRFYAPPAFYYPRPAFGFGWYGCADDVARPAVSLTLALRPAAPAVLPPPAGLPPAVVPPAGVPDGTFRYDGGPARPVPAPPADPEPPAVRSGLPGVKAGDTLFISMTRPAAEKPKPAVRYPAYGEKR